MVLFDLDGDKPIGVAPGHTEPIELVRFVDDGNTLVTAGSDSRVLFRPRAGDGYAGID